MGASVDVFSRGASMDGCFLLGMLSWIFFSLGVASINASSWDASLDVSSWGASVDTSSWSANRDVSSWES